MAVAVGSEPVVDPGDAGNGDHIDRDHDRGVPGHKRKKKTEEMALRKLRRSVARYRMKKDGIRKINKVLSRRWRKYLTKGWRPWKKKRAAHAGGIRKNTVLHGAKG